MLVSGETEDRLDMFIIIVQYCMQPVLEGCCGCPIFYYAISLYYAHSSFSPDMYCCSRIATTYIISYCLLLSVEKVCSI